MGNDPGASTVPARKNEECDSGGGGMVLAARDVTFAPTAHAYFCSAVLTDPKWFQACEQALGPNCDNPVPGMVATCNESANRFRILQDNEACHKEHGDDRSITTARISICSCCPDINLELLNP